jgi:hypothetical protein
MPDIVHVNYNPTEERTKSITNAFWNEKCNKTFEARTTQYLLIKKHQPSEITCTNVYRFG